MSNFSLVKNSDPSSTNFNRIKKLRQKCKISSENVKSTSTNVAESHALQKIKKILK